MKPTSGQLEELGERIDVVLKRVKALEQSHVELGAKVESIRQRVESINANTVRRVTTS